MIDRKRLDVLLEAALELPPEERAGFLEREGENEEVRAAVARLLAASAQATAAPLGGALWREMLDGERALAPGERLGAYRIEHELGRGGMAVVYLAARADGQYEHRVALKILERAANDGDAVARFERERQILASLDHPGIARILDGGFAPDGRPWFAMEFVEGQPIDAYCDAVQLDLEGRLRLFVEVGRAVAAAHRQLVVHRDIKPSNILVSSVGVPKLLDFGIAKLIEPEDAGPRDELTRTYVPMTPRYASPEQIAGRAVTTASDVYQLGLLLYELVCGEWAFEFPASTPSELGERASTREATRPSAAVAVKQGDERARRRGCSSARQLRKLLAGDLDTIVLAALRPQAERRYESASRLVEDVERYLDGRPILARPDAFLYRARKFVGRNRWAVAAAAAGLAVALGLSAFYAVRLRQERNAAEGEAQKARQVAQFLADLFRASDPFTAKMVADRTALELLDEGARQIAEGTALASQPEVKAALLDVMGDVYGGMGKLDRAITYSDQAVALRTRLLGPAHADTLESRQNRLELERLAGRLGEAAAGFRELVPLLERTHGPRHFRVAEAYMQLALSTLDSGSLDEARAMIDRALAIEREQHPVDPLRLSRLLTTESAVSSRAGDMARAAREARESIELQRRIDPGSPAIANTLGGLSGFLRNQGKLEEAREALLEAERLLLPRAGAEHPLTLKNSLRIADATLALNLPAEALARLERDLPVAEQVLGSSSYWIGYGYLEKATALVDLGRTAEAIPNAVRGRDGMEAALGKDAQLSIDANRRLANILKDAGRLAEARDLLRQTAAQAEAKMPPRTFMLPLTLKELGEVLFKLGDLDGAEAALLRSLALQAELWPDGHVDTVRSIAWHAEILAKKGEKERARAELRRALALALRVEGVSPYLAERLETLRAELLGEGARP